MTPDAFADAAHALAGTPFRLHGRDPETGVDCIGHVGCALAGCGFSPEYPSGYRLRNRAISQWLSFAERNGLEPVFRLPRRGDICLTLPGPGQHHLVVALGSDLFVHAHAGLRKVVVEPRTVTNAPLRQWRIPSRSEHLWQR